MAKRRSVRTTKYLQDEHQKMNRGETMQQTISKLRNHTKYYKRKNEELKRNITKLREEENKKARRVEVQLNREVRKRDTIIRNLKAKHEDFRNRTMKKARTIVYKNKYLEYQPPLGIKQYERRIEKLSNKSDEYLNYLEVILKSYSYAKENNLTINELTVLKYIPVFQTNVKGTKISDVIIDGITKGEVRAIFKRMYERGFLTKTSWFYNLTLEAKELIEGLEGYNVGSEIARKLKSFIKERTTDIDDII